MMTFKAMKSGIFKFMVKTPETANEKVNGEEYIIEAGLYSHFENKFVAEGRNNNLGFRFMNIDIEADNAQLYYEVPQNLANTQFTIYFKIIDP